MSISRRRGGGPRGPGLDESRARARRAAIYTKSVGIPDRWPRQNAERRRSPRSYGREREPVVAPFTKKLAGGEERSRVASGDEHRHLSGARRLPFSLSRPRNGFCAFRATINPLEAIFFFFYIYILIPRYTEFVNLCLETRVYS